MSAGNERSRPPDNITSPCPKERTTRNDPSVKTVSTWVHDPSDGLMKREPRSIATHRMATEIALMVSLLILALARLSGRAV
jgi:hypothetical protein